MICDIYFIVLTVVVRCINQNYIIGNRNFKPLKSKLKCFILCLVYHTVLFCMLNIWYKLTAVPTAMLNFFKQNIGN